MCYVFLVCLYVRDFGFVFVNVNGWVHNSILV